MSQTGKKKPLEPLSQLRRKLNFWGSGLEQEPGISLCWWGYEMNPRHYALALSLSHTNPRVPAVFLSFPWLFTSAGAQEEEHILSPLSLGFR